MLDSILSSATGGITLGNILLCTGASLVLGALICLLYMYKNSYSRNFVITLALLPVLVQSVIFVVNGNLGAGVAVMGAFSLVRFRSVPGSAREITSIFFAMAVGLATGMGYILYAVIFTAIIATVMLLYILLGLGGKGEQEKVLRVTIPEDIDYNGLFDDLFEHYAKYTALDKVKTTNLGSLFELQYSLCLKDEGSEKELLDEIRKRNGNLGIVCTRKATLHEETL